MSAKLARLEQQEQEFMDKYGKKNHTAETSTSSPDCLKPEACPNMNEKTKRKKSKRQEEPSETYNYLSSNYTGNCKPKKRKDFNGASVNDDMIADTEPKKKKKRSRKEKAPPEDCVDGDCSVEVNEAFTHTTSEEQDTHLLTDDRMHKKKKRSRKEKEAPEDCVDGDCSVEVNDAFTHTSEEKDTHLLTDDRMHKKKKKKKRSKVDAETGRRWDQWGFYRRTQQTITEGQYGVSTNLWQWLQEEKEEK